MRSAKRRAPSDLSVLIGTALSEAKRDNDALVARLAEAHDLLNEAVAENEKLRAENTLLRSLYWREDQTGGTAPFGNLIPPAGTPAAGTKPPVTPVAGEDTGVPSSTAPRESVCPR